MVRLAILLLTIAVTAARGDRISLEKTLIADATLQAVTFVDAQHGWAVGDRGVILATDDGGQHWRQQSSGVRCPLSGVCFISRAKGWAVGGGWKPYLHTSYGVVLATDDGGLTWRRLPTPTLPLLRGVKFFDDQQGAAWGAASAFHPCGLFLTDDGGRGWRMLPSDRPASWNAADFTSLDNGLCAGAHGALATIAERGLRMRTAEAVLADLHAVRVDGKLNWAVGDGATIAVSTDRGASWRSALPLAEHDPATALNFQAIEARGGQAWVAGTPGSVIAHTTDGGANWNVAATRQTAPINDICFIDDSRGWAVGAGGVILSTVDGGATWNIIRNANQQPALCVVCPTMASVPLEYLTRCALADGYRTQVLLLEEGSPEELSCVSEAAVACGATSVERTTSADLAVRLATHQPLVIVAVESSLTSSPTSSQVTTGLDACSTLSRREQLTALGLSPPTPRRVVRITPDETGQWNAADFMATLGASPAQIAEPYEGWLKTSRTQNTHKYRFEVVRGDALPSLHRGDVLADCVLAFDSPRRRPLTAPADGQIENLRRLVQQRKHVEALLKRSLHGEAWANQVVTLTAGLSPEQGAPLLLELADSYRERGDFDQMAETWYLLARRYADHPLCESTIQSLLLYYASSEYAHFAESRRLPPGTDAARLADVSAESETTGAVLPVTAIEEGKASGVLSLAERRRRAQLLGEYLEQSRPTLFAEPRIRFALAACAPADTWRTMCCPKNGAAPRLPSAGSPSRIVSPTNRSLRSAPPPNGRTSMAKSTTPVGPAPPPCSYPAPAMKRPPVSASLAMLTTCMSRSMSRRASAPSTLPTPNRANAMKTSPPTTASPCASISTATTARRMNSPSTPAAARTIRSRAPHAGTPSGSSRARSPSPAGAPKPPSPGANCAMSPRRPFKQEQPGERGRATSHEFTPRSASRAGPGQRMTDRRRRLDWCGLSSSGERPTSGTRCLLWRAVLKCAMGNHSLFQ